MIPLHYTLIVTQAAYGQQGGATALRFAQALCHSGHHLDTVFFYLDGTMHANHLLSPASDEENIHTQWIELSKHRPMQLLVCVSAAERRGIIAQQTALQRHQTHFNIEPPFEIAGLAEMTMAMLKSDRVVQL